MALTVSCRCGQLLAVQQEHVGKAVACPRCHAVLTVTAPAPPPAPAAPPEEELVELTPIEEQEEELPELIPVEDEDGGSYQVQNQDRAGVEFALSGDMAAIRLRADAIECLAYGPDQRTALAADEDRLFFLDLKEKKGIPTQRTHNETIRCLAFSADGLRALSGDARGGLLLWDVPPRKPVRWLVGHGVELTSLAFAPGGRLAASADASGFLRLWDLDTGRAYALPQARCEEAINCVCFSPDGRLLLAIDAHGNTRLWDLRTRQLGARMAKGCADLGSAAFGPDGSYAVASSVAEFKARRWDVRTGERQRCFASFSKKRPHIQRTLVSPNGRVIVAAGFTQDYTGRTRRDGALLAAAAVIVPVPVVLSYGALAAAKLAQSDVTGQNFFLELWDLATERAVQAVAVGQSEPTALALSADGHRVLAGFGRGQVRLFAL